MTDRTLQQHIEDDRNEIDNPITSGQRRRHLESELESLEQYQNNHPNEDHDPTPFELYCDENPNALECRVYEN
jgi:hypothetical protein